MCRLFLATAVQAGSVNWTFDTDPSIDMPGFVIAGTAAWRPDGGVNNTGYIAVTDAANDQRGRMVFPDIDAGNIIVGFDFTVDFRVGGGTASPADGFSINYARSTDPVLARINETPPVIVDAWAGKPNADGAVEANLPEEGTTTGLGIGFDAWQSGARAPNNVNHDTSGSGTAGLAVNNGYDVIGISVRVDNILIAQWVAPVLNGGTE